MTFQEREIPTSAGERLLQILESFREEPTRENWDELSGKLVELETSDHLTETLELLAKVIDSADPSPAAIAQAQAQAKRALNAVKPPRIMPISEAPSGLPAPVLWADWDTHLDPMLSEGEICLLSAAGGTGKSYLTLALAAAASEAFTEGNSYGAACGLRVRPGPVVLISYEDSDQRMKYRLQTMGKLDVSEHIYILKEPDPLYFVDQRSGARAFETSGWSLLWAAVRELSPSLVVIDPAGSALEGVSQGESQPVRTFIRALEMESKEGKWGTLVVAHDNKAHRNTVSGGGALNSGAVSGSAAWIDAARAILFLRKTSQDRRLLTALKANYGTDGWGAELVEVVSPLNNAFAGYQLDGEVMTEEEVEQLINGLAAASRAQGNSSGSGNGRVKENVYEGSV